MLHFFICLTYSWCLNILKIAQYYKEVIVLFKNLTEAKEFCNLKGIKMIDFKITDLVGRWHHLSIPVSRLNDKILEEGIGFDGSNYGFKTVEKSDMVFIPDFSTAFIDPFCEIPTLSMIGDIYTLEDGIRRYEADPRYIAEKAEKYLISTGIADENIIGPEFEFYLFDKIAYESRPEHQEVTIDSLQAEWNTNDHYEKNLGYKVRHKGGYHAALPYDMTNDLRSKMTIMLEEFGMPIKYHHHEVGGPAQVELEVEPGKMKDMADKTYLLKYVVKNLAIQNGKSATFMPKPMLGEAGSGMHVHMWLYKDGKPLFYDKDGYSGLSQMALYFIGGLLKHSPALLAITSPSTNSYKRLVPGYEAPVSICFATANRSAVVRIPGYGNSPDSRRFEFRPSDATCNPYLAYSALLMAGIDGIINKIDPVKEGFGPYDVNIFELDDEEKKKIKALPKSLEEAMEALRKDHEFLLKGGVFTKHLLETWIKSKIEKEHKKISIIPHPAEFELYYDL
ncbi:MAG: type I glutamate--ammonia ligase [Gracilibacteraceae bacterium]|nr:type I glutamate--ammonia ligase [Gracilibacteraceae bacterium]